MLNLKQNKGINNYSLEGLTLGKLFVIETVFNEVQLKRELTVVETDIYNFLKSINHNKQVYEKKV